VDKLKKYQKSAMKLACVESLGDEGFSATIPGFPGLVVFGESKRKVLGELQGALEDWIELSLKRGYGLPSLHANPTASR